MMFGLTGGMMLYVCIAELLPAAYGEKGVCTDALTLASDDATHGVSAPLLTWVLIVCKLGAVGMLVFHKDAFV